MRRFLMAAGMVFGLGVGMAGAHEGVGEKVGRKIDEGMNRVEEHLDDRGEKMTSQGDLERTRRIHRWGFNLAGGDYDGRSLCGGRAVASVRDYRDGDDIMYSIFSLGWYTPKHVAVTCGINVGSAAM